ncbi:serine/threonine protein phosphatase 2C, putative [Perkinsus marinus ATCC 50983]|uniref:Serine/threonine protein phosphatase 2C, putative n=1 Tax=Perkinsus marinus (strain ATCC 50983 / TXsc) TaxID=423536 RepID=C5LES3_PERM5|nr:serine/threonine protein phosphatase 2C, putative [Perkinsus marinus ATCC 50983]EER04770.1 serine/threonine protein phosphatase 2C, putative [Perkinsus marinus ATCC 50983]|eukprot:XP_002772954.1 serine/threonine protein phosphatase 2C, putative [Perkinsus marinus ATCC 50983]
MNVDDDFTVYGVFDGHGLHGHNVSNFVKEQLVKLILEHPKESIQEGAQLDKALRTWFPAIQDKLELATKSGELDASCSGSTSTLCVHCHETDTITAAWVGDSRAVLAYGSSPTVVEMTTDHRPERPQERARIEKTGGRVVGYDGHCCYRVYVRGHSYPGLNMSRAMGDLIAYYRAGVIPTPDTRRKQVVRDPERSSPSGLSYVSNNFSWHPGDPFLLVCSDGVWEFISSDEAVSLVSMILTSSSQAQEAAEFLAKKACRRWLDQGGGVVIDDITVIVSCLMPHPRSPRSPQYY